MEPHKRSRSWRRIKKKTPGGRYVIHLEKRKPGIARCAICKKPLHGIPRERPYKMRNIAKSEKKVNRKYGGYLCSKCSRELIKQEVRA